MVVISVPEPQDLGDHSRVFDATVLSVGNDFDVSIAVFVFFNVDIEDTLKPLHPGHRVAALFNGFILQQILFY